MALGSQEEEESRVARLMTFDSQSGGPSWSEHQVTGVLVGAEDLATQQ